MVKVISEYILWFFGVRTYFDSQAGTVDYENGIIKINSILITSVSNVDGSASTQFRLTVLPSSNDVIPVRNQLLEIDTVNTTVVGTVDQTATTGRGYTVNHIWWWWFDNWNCNNHHHNSRNHIIYCNKFELLGKCQRMIQNF